ncbi:MAG: glutathione S-transferase family protein [Rhodobacteraceae bacterium]|nr:glutathione S-transferase family protein [Paracoccaceae bacterium]
MYTVIGNARTRAFRILWMLEELGVPYTHIPAAPHADEVRSHYPAGKVPVLIEDGTALTDSTAILTYLADKHSAFTFPAGTLDRAHQDGHTQFILDEMDALLWTAARHSFILPEQDRVPDVKNSLKREFVHSLERLQQRLGEGPYLMGDTMTIADILAGHCSRWAENAKFPDAPAPLQVYFERLRNRPAWQRAGQT